MSTAKSPISILQELAAAKLTPAPEYLVTQEADGFKCELKVAGITVGVTSNSKKIAKHLCASKALSLLQTTKLDNNSSSSSETSLNQKENPIGQLNQICSQKRANLPVYTDRGCDNGNFIIECRCLSYMTMGESPTKKVAKRLAAMEMLRKPDFSYTMKTSSAVIAKMNEVFKDVDIGICEAQPQVDKATNEDNTYVQENLDRELKKLGYLYTVNVLQEVPLIVLLKVSKVTDGIEHTFVKSCETYNEALIDLLKGAIEAIKVLNP